MEFRYKKNFFRFYLFLFSVLLFSFSGCQSRSRELDLGMYQYRDTRDLVRFVYYASLELQKEGIQTIDRFRGDISKYRTSEYYLYIYTIDGTNLFHAGMPELEGKNLFHITDKNGKQIIRLILRAIENPENPHGWVHYTWWEPGKFYPVPESSCHFKVITPEGKEIFVGAGFDYPHEEKEFIRIVVDDAVNLINREGKGAIEKIRNPFSEYNYRDVSVFVFSPDGSTLISPVVNEQIPKMNIVDCVDEVGHKPFEKALKLFREKDRTWEVFLAKSRYRRGLIKKCIYLRKTLLQGKEIYVGAVTDLPQPP